LSFEHKEQFDLNFFVEFEVAHLSVLMVQRLPHQRFHFKLKAYFKPVLQDYSTQ